MLARGVFRGGAQGARAPPSASSPVYLGSTAGLFYGCSTSVLSNPACNSYLLTYYVLESRHRRDRDRHRQPSISARFTFALIINWAGHPTSTTPTNNNNHVELAQCEKKIARGKYLLQLCVSTPLSQILDTPLLAAGLDARAFNCSSVRVMMALDYSRAFKLIASVQMCITYTTIQLLKIRIKRNGNQLNILLVSNCLSFNQVASYNGN